MLNNNNNNRFFFLFCRWQREEDNEDDSPDEPCKLLVCMLPCLDMLMWYCTVIENVKC